MRCFIKLLLIVFSTVSLSNAQTIDMSILTIPNEKQLLNKDGRQLFQVICDLDTNCGEYFVVGDEVIFGSFTHATVSEAVVFGTICDNFCETATKLFQLQDGNWKVLYGHLSGDACTSFKTDNQTDILVCQNESVWDFNIEAEAPVDPRVYSYSLDVFEANSRNWQKTTLIQLKAPLLPSCQAGSNIDVITPFVYNFQFRKADVNKDSYMDITLDVELLENYCFSDMSNEPVYKQQEKVQLVWLFDGGTFTPLETTREFLSTYKLEGN